MSTHVEENRLHVRIRSTHAIRSHCARGALLAAAFAAMSVAAMGATAADATVEITKFAFAPKEITVAPGTRVVFVNHDETPHTVAAADKSFASKGLDTGERYEHVFGAEGDFAYLCTVHPFMTGVVHVRKR
jgi:plastocyanin